MDGARLWGCEPFYERSLQEISELFDTVYVSFYKQLGGLPGPPWPDPKMWWPRPVNGARLMAAHNMACF
jgi:hypothetical protein